MVSARSLRILVLAPAPSFHTERYVAELRRQECEVLLASLGTSTDVNVELAKKGPHRFFHHLFAASEIRSLVKEWHPDIVNPHYAAAYGFSVARTRIDRSIPIVLNLWGGDILLAPHKSWLHRQKIVNALRAADYVFGDSQYVIDQAKRLTTLTKAQIIPWGIESDYLKYHKQSCQFANPVRIISPRRQEPLYNNEIILESLLPLIQRKQITLTFANFGEQANFFKERCQALGQSGISFYDPMPREEYLSFVAEHDIYLSAATVDSSPVTLIESMALGLIPVVGDTPGIREWLTSESGFSFDIKDKHSLTKQIEQLLNTKDTFSEMRRKNLERVKDEAIFENNIAKQVAIMRELAESHRGVV